MEGEQAPSLTPAEQAYVSSGGTTELPSENVTETTTPSGDGADTVSTPSEPNEPETKEMVSRVVPQEALHQEREHRKAIQREANANAERAARAEERLSLLMRANQPENEGPKLEEDPVGYFKHRDEIREQEIRYLAQQQQQRQEYEKVSQYQGSVVNAYKASVAETAKENPDFNEAYQYVTNARIEALMEAGYSNQQATEQAQADEFAIVETALRQGKNPSKAVYGIAKRFGYRPAPKGATGAEKLDQVAKGQSENKSLGQASGTASQGLSIDSILAMSDAEIAKLKPEDYKKVMGG